MAQRALPVPEPLLDSDGDVGMFSTEIEASLVRVDRLDGCVACQRSTMYRWPLHALVRALDGEGERTVTLNDGTEYRYRRSVPQAWRDGPEMVGLHPTCTGGVMDAWAWAMHGEEPTREGEPAPRTQGPAVGSARRQGAYGRRRSD